MHSCYCCILSEPKGMMFQLSNGFKMLSITTLNMIENCFIQTRFFSPGLIRSHSYLGDYHSGHRGGVDRLCIRGCCWGWGGVKVQGLLRENHKLRFSHLQLPGEIGMYFGNWGYSVFLHIIVLYSSQYKLSYVSTILNLIWMHIFLTFKDTIFTLE